MTETTNDHSRPDIEDSVTMLYYEDLAQARAFYGEVLGLPKRFEEDWVTFYELTPGATVGLVRADGDAFHPVRTDNSVMLSLVCDDVDAWYERIRAAGTVELARDLRDSPGAPVRGFIVRDPGNYTVEFFQWR